MPWRSCSPASISTAEGSAGSAGLGFAAAAAVEFEVFKVDGFGMVVVQTSVVVRENIWVCMLVGFILFTVYCTEYIFSRIF